MKRPEKARSTMLAGGLRFATVQELLDHLPQDERALTEEIRELLISEAPELKERLSFNVPFYKQHRDVCFIWPASVIWGGRKTYDGVRFALTSGHLVPGCEPYLHRGGRKQVLWRDLTTITAADERMIRRLLRAALAVDRERSQGLR